jgi:hypothetical protein
VTVTQSVHPLRSSVVINGRILTATLTQSSEPSIAPMLSIYVRKSSKRKHTFVKETKVAEID